MVIIENQRTPNGATCYHMPDEEGHQKSSLRIRGHRAEPHAWSRWPTLRARRTASLEARCGGRTPAEAFVDGDRPWPQSRWVLTACTSSCDASTRCSRCRPMNIPPIPDEGGNQRSSAGPRISNEYPIEYLAGDVTEDAAHLGECDEIGRMSMVLLLLPPLSGRARGMPC